MRKPTTDCQRVNSKVAGPAVYKNIAEFNKIENSSPYNGEEWGRLTMKRCGRGGHAGSVKANEVWINLLEIPLHWAGERKTP